MRTVSLLALAFVLVSCSSSKVTDKLDKEYETQTSDSGEKVGVKDDKIVIQKRIYLEEQLAILESEVEDLQNAAYGKSKTDPGGLWEALRRCEKRLADPRIGGDGSPEAIPKWKDLATKEVAYAHTVEKKNIVAVTEEALADRIVRLQKSKRLLTKQFDSLKEKQESCQDKYKLALVKHGLNPDDTKAKGEWVQGPRGYKVWKMKKSATTDPEELMRRKKK